MNEISEFPTASSDSLAIKREKSPHKEAVEKQKLRLAIVVPIFNEYRNGNLIELIRWFSKQSHPSLTEGIFVVNNTAALAGDRADEFLDNQQSLKIIGLTQNKEPLPDNLTDYERQAIEAARQKNIKIHTIDLSSPENAPGKREIGKIRNIGVEMAIQHFEKQELDDRGIIAMLDADSLPEPGYIRKVINHFPKDSEAKALFVSMDYTPALETSGQLTQALFQAQFNLIHERLMAIIGDNTSLMMSTPQIIATVRAFKQIGGVPDMDKGEDRRLGENLITSVNTAYDGGIRVLTQDRARAGSYDGKDRLESLEGGTSRFTQSLELVNFKIDLLTARLTRIIKTGEKITPEQLNSLLEEHQLAPDPTRAKSEIEPLWERSQNLGTDFLKIFLSDRLGYLQRQGIEGTVPLGEYVADLHNYLSQKAGENEKQRLQTFLRRTKRKENLLRSQRRTLVRHVMKEKVADRDPTLSPYQNNILKRNPWMVNEIEQLNPSLSEKEKTLLIEEKFAELLKPLADTRYQEDMVTFRVLTDFLYEARFNSKDYPFIHKLLTETI